MGDTCCYDAKPMQSRNVGNAQDTPSVTDHMNRLHRRIVELERNLGIARDRLNKIERCLGVCFDVPIADLDVENLSFPV